MSDEQASNSFVKAFVPGLVVGFVLGAIVGVVITATGGDVQKLGSSNEPTIVSSGERAPRDGIVENLEQQAGELADEAGQAVDAATDELQEAVDTLTPPADESPDGSADTPADE
ncbi:MAG: hypothetical protein AAFR96_05895 [Planctomycetota bacterium]